MDTVSLYRHVPGVGVCPCRYGYLFPVQGCITDVGIQLDHPSVRLIDEAFVKDATLTECAYFVTNKGQTVVRRVPFTAWKRTLFSALKHPDKRRYPDRVTN